LLTYNNEKIFEENNTYAEQKLNFGTYECGGLPYVLRMCTLIRSFSSKHEGSRDAEYLERREKVTTFS